MDRWRRLKTRCGCSTPPPDLCALELGCGSGHSLRYLAERGARELWGVDLSPVQIAFAEETLRPFASRCRLFESPMEMNPGIPAGYFDLVFSIWGMGWTEAEGSLSGFGIWDLGFAWGVANPESRTPNPVELSASTCTSMS